MRQPHLLGKTLTILFVAAAIMTLPINSWSEPKFGKISDEEWQIGPPADYPEANAVVVLDDGFIDVNIRDLKIERLVRIKVLTKAGIDEVGELVVRYHKDDKLRNFKAHTIAPGGKKQKVEKDAIFERVDGEYKERVFSFPQVEAGCILEYCYRIVTERYHYLKPWYFQGRLYTLKSSIDVRLELGFDYNASFYNIPPELRQPKKEEQININFPNDPFKKLVNYSWTLTNLPPITREPYMGCYNDHRSAVKFQLLSWQSRRTFRTYVDTWDNLGNELLDRYDTYLHRKKSDIKSLTEEITAGLTTPREKSKALYDYVKSEFANSTDYVTWYFVHNHAGKLFEERSGSAEAKNLLLIEMHKAVGINAFPILISTREHGRIFADNPDHRQFNHLQAYLEFGDGWAILDATNKNNPYGVLPPNCLVNNAFLLDKDQSQLIRIPDNPQNSVRTDQIDMCIDDEGHVTCSTVCSFTGYYASDYSEMYEENPLEDFVKDEFVESLNVTYTLRDFECRLDTTGEFITKIDFDSDDLAEQLDNNLIVTPVCYCFKSSPFKSEKRSFPVDFQYPFTYKNVVNITLPNSVESCQLPADTTLDIGGATFERKALTKDSCVTITSTLKVTQPLFKPVEYNKLRKFFSDVALVSDDELVAILSDMD